MLEMQDKDGFVTKNEFLAISSKITPAQVGTFLKVIEIFTIFSYETFEQF